VVSPRRSDGSNDVSVDLDHQQGDIRWRQKPGRTDTAAKLPRSPGHAGCLRGFSVSSENGLHFIAASSSETGIAHGKDETLRESLPWNSLDPMDRIPHVVSAKVCGPYSLRLVFDDGVKKQVNLRRYLRGPVYKPVREPAYFARVFVDHELGTIVWPNGADFAPETLYELPDERGAA